MTVLLWLALGVVVFLAGYECGRLLEEGNSELSIRALSHANRQLTRQRDDAYRARDFWCDLAQDTDPIEAVGLPDTILRERIREHIAKIESREAERLLRSVGLTREVER